MARWVSYIDNSVGDGANTIAGIISNGPTYGIGISSDVYITGLSTFSDVARFSSTVRLDGQLRDGDNNFGSSGQVLSSDGTDTRWVNAGSLSAGAASQVAINDDSNTNASRFLTFVDSSSGNNSIKTDPQLTYNPSTNVISTAGIELDDDKEIVFGDNSDLKIYHDPSSNGGSKIDHVGHDDLRLRIGGNQMVFEKTSGENFIVMTHSNGEVELCHNDSVKLTTTSSGVTITGTATATAFSGPLTGNVTGNISGNAGSATILANARTIGGVSFNGSANINLPGVNQAGNQNTSGNAGSATVLETTRNFSISGEITANAQSFNGSGNVTLSATVDDNIIDEANLKISNSPTNGRFLQCNTGVSGGLTWADVTLPTSNTLSGSTLASGITASSITSLGTLTGLTVNGNITQTGNTTQTGQVTISKGFTSDTDFHLYLRQTTNGEGATIKFVDDTGATQFGLFTYKHQNSSSNSAGNSFHFDSSETSTAVIIDQTSGDSGYYVGTNEVFHEGNDGSGSGLDADKLDNQEGSYYRNASNLNDGTVPDARLSSSSLFVTGMILMYTGSSAPSGWAICNGSNGTPDLRNRFIVAAGSSYAVDNTGGANTVTLSTANLPSHTHSFSGNVSNANLSHSHSWSGNTNNQGSHSHEITDRSSQDSGDGFQGYQEGQGGSGSNNVNSSTSGGHTHSVSGNTNSQLGNHNHSFSGTTGGTGSGNAHENRPPYYALMFIMKL